MIAPSWARENTDCTSRSPSTQTATTHTTTPARRACRRPRLVAAHKDEEKTQDDTHVHHAGPGMAGHRRQPDPRPRRGDPGGRRGVLLWRGGNRTRPPG